MSIRGSSSAVVLARILMTTKKKSFIESTWFTAIMSVVAVVVLVENVVRLWGGDMLSLIRIPIWLLIAYYFISMTRRS